MTIEVLSSSHNPKIKDLQKLIESSKERRSRGLFPVEGKREIMSALASGLKPVSLFICPELAAGFDISCVMADKTYSITESLYSSLAYRGSTEGVIALFEMRELSLENIKPGSNPLIIVLESVEKPGNLGAVLRTADASGADAVILCDPLTDMYNPNVIRASLGGIFTVPCAQGSSKEVFEWLRSRGIKTYAAELNASDWYHCCDFKSPSALVMGTESTGLTDFWLERCDRRIKIPMLGKLDSLNVSVSTAILCFEAMRQRNFNGLINEK